MAFPLCMHSGLPAEKVKQMIMTSLDDVTMITHAIGEGSIQGELTQALGLLSGS